MKLSDIAAQYADRFLEKYSQCLLPGHIKALQAIQHCRTSAAGMTLLECNSCRTRDQKPMSCGHRHCNRCQNTDTSEWLQRQRQKLLPVEYFMVTFTLPAQLRNLAWQHQRQVYDLLFRTAADTLKEFGSNSKKLDAGLGMTGVLHTHSRRLDYHPHIHFVVPGGGINTRRKEWRKLTGNYLFNGKNLAMVFRAKLLRALDEQGLLSPSLKTRLPKEWVVNCKRVGKGLPALEYLSRYLYRGVISDNNILASKRGKVTFSYLNSETGKKEKRTLPGEDFLWLVLKHVLPRRLRRSRDYGFLHSNAKKQLSLVQLVLNVMVKAVEPVIRPKFTCRHCGESMKHIAFSFLKPT
ncbi:IS91 family transposase [Endozoicomonas sp. 8E]|uniref:IS91 family transposase n=1 Tax=Endozoicomonas sp. 8E TaxID=3035692 RepID=UPI0029392308|nr:IS91 family transposase [Endozoicomonas sp. 8E]WOG30138.1 IS91 family transposase [Endozoicomonas sp. 8E]